MRIPALIVVCLLAACSADEPLGAEESDGSSSSTENSTPGSTEGTETAATGSETSDGGSSEDSSSEGADDSSSSSTGPQPSPLVAMDDVVYASSDAVLVIATADGVLANDTFPGMPSITDFSPQTEAGGAVEVDPDGGFTYTPVPGFWGEDAFTYEIGDGVEVDEARVTIWVAPHGMGLSALLDRGAFVVHSTQQYTVFGRSVGAAGDVNGDGLADLLVGSPGPFDTGGRAFVVFGGAELESGPHDMVGDEIPGFRIIGSTIGDSAGASVDGVGDANGDGLDDVVVANDRHAPGVEQSPLAYVVFGKVDEDDLETSDLLAGEGGFGIVGEGLDSGVRIDVSGAGDIDGDGQGDILVARHTPYAAETPRVYVVFGKSDGDEVDLDDIAAGDGGFVIYGETVDDYAEISIDGAGDVDGDGLDDVVVGALGVVPPGQNAVFSGRAYVVFGKPDGAAVQLVDVVDGDGGFTIDGQPADALGLRVSAAGDVDGDGLADVLVSVPRHSEAGLEYRGAVLVIFGKGDTSTVQSTDVVAGDGGFAILGAEAQASLGGEALAGIGDFDGDGHTDLVAVANDDSVGVSSGLYAFVTYGRDGTAPIDLAEAGDGDGFGLAADLAYSYWMRVAGLGDFNGDGLDDLAVASPFDELPDVYGRVYVMYGVRTDPDAP